MAHEVFICYASRDKAIAEAVCAALEARSIKCWIAPRDVLPGTEWAETIVDALDTSRILVLVLSSSSNTSPQVIREVGRAASNGIPIIPLRIDDVIPSKAMDYFVSSHQWLDAQKGPLKKHLQRLADILQQILARRRAPGVVTEITEAEEKAKREAEEAARARREAEETRRAREAEEITREEAEKVAKERAEREAEEARKAKEAAARAKKEEAAARAKREAEEARKAREAEERARKEAEKAAKEKAKREAEEARKAREAEERARKKAEKAAKEKAKREAEEATKTAQPVTYCPKCGVKLRPNVSFCPKCGASVSEAARAKKAKEKPPAFAERLVKPLLKRRWLWAGAAAVLVALIFVLVNVFQSPGTPSVAPPGEETPSEEAVTTTPPTTPTEEASWWETKWGEPKYGGTLVYRATFIDVVTDPLDPRAPQFGPWLEALFMDDMTVDRDEFGFGCNFFPVEYRAGQLAESWEQPDPTTVVVYLRQGVVWKGGPAEGREFTSDDVVYTYDKVLGVGEFAGEDPNSVFSGVIPSVTECVAIDRYTVEFHLSSTSFFTIYEVLNPWMSITIAPREWYEELTEEEQADWHNVTGTGPFMLTDYGDGTSMTCARNPDYYGIDARYGNKLPYADAFKILVIPDMDTALAALRTGQIDILADARTYPTLPAAQQLAQTSPEINQFSWPVGGPGVFFHWDQGSGTITPPFDDIKVRTAMQLAIDNALIAETYYFGTVDGTPTGLMSPLAEDWDFPFDEWPVELQAEYGYDLEAARQLMTAAGYVSNPLEVEILTSTSDDLELLEILQAQFADIGINMTINSMGMMEQRPLVQQGNFELLWTSITGGTNSSPKDVIQSFYSQKFERIGMGGGVIDAAYDAIVERFMAATTEAEAQDIFKEADRYWLEQHWAVITFPSWSTQFHQPWIKGYMGERFWSTMTWTYFAHMWKTQI